MTREWKTPVCITDYRVEANHTIAPLARGKDPDPSFNLQIRALFFAAPQALQLRKGVVRTHLMSNKELKNFGWLIRPQKPIIPFMALHGVRVTI